MNRLKNLIEAAKPFDALYQPDGPISHWDRETDDRAIFGVNKKTVYLGDFRRLRRALAEAEAPAELPAGALAILDPVIRDPHSGAPVGINEEMQAARAAVAKMLAAAELVLLRPDMSTVRGRMEMNRRLRVLAEAAAGMKGGAA